MIHWDGIHWSEEFYGFACWAFMSMTLVNDRFVFFAV
jgi:hypothetical protein